MTRLRGLIAATFLLASFAADAQGAAKARAEAEALARAALPAAQEMLLAHGEFAPFGMGMAAGDEVVDIKNSAPGADRAEPADPVSALRRSLAEALRQGNVRATALVYEARLEVKGPHAGADAIAIALAHRDGYAAIVVYPYEFRDGRIAIGEPHLIEQKPLPKAPPKRRR
jgi:hypothetical protein